jgi:hypothetical protein
MRLLITALILLVLPASADAKRSACQRLKGQDRAPAAGVKLVKVPNQQDSTDLKGCLLPRGKVQLVAFGEDYVTSVNTYRIRQVAGPVVLIGKKESNQYNTSTFTYVFNLRTRSDYDVASFNSDAPPDQTTAEAAFITRTGAAVAARVPFMVDRVDIVAFSPTGEENTLDTATAAEIPPSSLGLTDGTASWTHSGEVRSAPLG